MELIKKQLLDIVTLAIQATLTTSDGAFETQCSSYGTPVMDEFIHIAGDPLKETENQEFARAFNDHIAAIRFGMTLTKREE